MSEERASNALMRVAGTILSDQKLAEVPWTGVTIIASIGWWETPMLNSLSGFYYTSTPMWEGETVMWEGLLLQSRDLFEERLVELAKALSERDEKDPFIHSMIQIDKDSAELTTKFDYSEESPWVTDVANLDSWVESLRPPKREN